jgi:hypothetical protein
MLHPQLAEGVRVAQRRFQRTQDRRDAVLRIEAAQFGESRKLLPREDEMSESNGIARVSAPASAPRNST